jgi:two-component system, chemotaxis family, CheB/CheR fusion protein
LRGRDNDVNTSDKIRPVGLASSAPLDDPKELAPDFPVVGIGASAGGLETFTQLLAHLPTDTGMAFILVQHLDPSHPSLLAEILSRVTKMPVSDVEGLVKIIPNHIYVMPANRDLILLDGVLRVEVRKETYGMPTSIDSFFQSLAKDAKNRAIGIILSGTGADGAHGITEIKAEGGITIAQEVSTAKFSDMPRNAIATECVDFILSPEGIAKELTRIAKHPYLCDGRPVRKELFPSEKSAEPADILNILKIVHKATGVDFNSYKRNTISRRIFRRMLLGKKENFKDYLEFLIKDPSEVHALYQDLLIGVTSFFRDPETFEVLKTKIFPELIKERDADNTIRIWVAGCATGEEVYSLGMCLIDFLDSEKARYPIQIFGTDVSDPSVDKARSGIYRESSISTIPPDYLKRFFTKADNGYQINKNIRDICIFARQNVATDPPFSSLDLISCRNVLIYLEPVLQKRVISLFHYALKSSGFLMLGNAESAGAFSDLFSQQSKFQKVYSKKIGVGRPRFDFVPGYVGRSLHPGKSTFEIKEPSGEDGPFDLDRNSDTAVLANLAPSGVTINEHFEVVRMRGRTEDFLEAPSGRLTNDILKMAKPGLRGELAKAIHKANRDDIPIHKNNLKIKSKGDFLEASIKVIPFRSGSSKTRFFEVLFFESASSNKSSKKGEEPEDSRMVALEKELTDTQEYLQSIVDRERSASSDLRAVNEEILSSNEEIQSSNEELETAKEELQSTNEELATVNDELNHRNQSLSELNSDLNNLLGTVHVPVIMLSRDLVIRRFSTMAETIINLTPGDVGRSIRDFKPKLNIPDLVEIVTNVIENVSEHSQEIQDDQGRWFSLRIRPYQSIDRKIDGAIIALIDIGTLKNMRDYAEAIVRTIRESLVVLDSGLRVKTANPHFYKAFSTTPDRTEKKFIYELNNGEWDIPEFRKLLSDILPKDSYVHDFEMIHSSKADGPRTLLLNASALKDGSKEGDFILLAIEDVTERTKATHSLGETSAALAKANLELEQFAFVASHDLQEPLRMVSSFMQLLSRRYKGKLDPEADEYIDIAVDGAKRMQLLVHDLLHLSQVGKGDPKYEIVDTTHVLKEIVSGLKNLIDETSAKVTSDLLPTLSYDRILLGQVFQNLIVNAIKFRDGKAPLVHVSAIRKGNEWEFSVKDNGIGIEKQYSDRIFLIFQRLHTKEAYAGTGIGLAMCKKIVERYGGRIWVESELGLGSTFFFTLPVLSSSPKITAAWPNPQ